MIDWASDYTASWRVMRVDPVTWADAEEVAGVTEISVQRNNEQLRETGSVEMTMAVGDEPTEMWCRVEMLATQGASIERVPIATLLTSPTDSVTEKGRQAVTAEGRSVLSPAVDEKLLAGTYVPKGADGAAWAARMLSCCPCPISVEGSFYLNDHMVFAGGTTKLEAAWMLLDASGWTLQIGGDGRVTIMPKPTTPSLELDAANTRLLVDAPKTSRDLLSVPNRYVAVQDDVSAMAINDDPYDPLSTVQRGRYVDEYDSSPTLVDGETLQAYAERMLVEKRVSLLSKVYTREWWPNVTIDSIVSGGIASVGMVGKMRVTAQSLTCGRGVTVQETAEVI